MAELYKFTTEGVSYGFTPSIISRTFEGLVYNPTLVTRSTIKNIENFAKTPLSFKFSENHFFALDMLKYMPETPVLVVVYRNDLPVWQGRVLGAKATRPYINVECDSLYTDIARGGATQKATLLCRHILYSEDCGVVQNLWGTTYTCTATTSTVAISGITQPVNYFNNGIATMQGQKRRILRQDAGAIYLTHAFRGELTGDIELFPGCPLTEDGCTSFSNLIRGGMLARMPVKNPFKATGAL